MKTVVISALMILAAVPAFAKGKCSKQATEAAVNFWADVPNPSEQLEYFVISSEPSAPRSNVYIVKMGFNDGNETTQGGYEVTFADVANCSGAKVKVAN